MLKCFFMFVPLSCGSETAQNADCRINCVIFLMLKNFVTVDFPIIRFYIKNAPFWMLVFSLSYAQGVVSFARSVVKSLLSSLLHSYSFCLVINNFYLCSSSPPPLLWGNLFIV